MKLKKINEIYERLVTIADEYAAARSEGWAAIAELLADGPVKVVLPQRYVDKIKEELESIPEGLEREAMATKGGPGYMLALQAVSHEIRYSDASGRQRMGTIESLCLDDGIRLTLIDNATEEAVTVGIDAIVDEVAPVIMFLQEYAREKE